MDIGQALMAVHSKRQAMAIVEFIGDNAQRFDEFVRKHLPHTTAAFQKRAREIL